MEGTDFTPIQYYVKIIHKHDVRKASNNYSMQNNNCVEKLLDHDDTIALFERQIVETQIHKFWQPVVECKVNTIFRRTSQ